MINILFIGDIVGEDGISLTLDLLPRLRSDFQTQLVIANGENADRGKGLRVNSARRLHDAGVDVITSGNHIWESKKDSALNASIPYVLRPHNYHVENPGKGVHEVQIMNGLVVRVINLQGKSFMFPIDCPFNAADELLGSNGRQNGINIIDFHAESTAEKMAFGWYVDGRASLVIGTHTHVQTSDDRIFPNGTGYITDAGMTGPHNGVIGMKKELAIRRFRRHTPVYYELAKGDLRLNGLVAAIDESNGKCTNIRRLNFSKAEYNAGKAN